MKTQFDHEKLKVYQESIAFNAWVGKLLGAITARAAVKDQLDRAATSIPLNIAEGNGKFSGKDRARFFEIARGSAVECAASLDVMVARELTVVSEIEPAKAQLIEIVNMLMGLLRRFLERDDRVCEDATEFGLLREQEQEISMITVTSKNNRGASYSQNSACRGSKSKSKSKIKKIPA